MLKILYDVYYGWGLEFWKWGASVKGQPMEEIILTENTIFFYNIVYIVFVCSALFVFILTIIEEYKKVNCSDAVGFTIIITGLICGCAVINVSVPIVATLVVLYKIITSIINANIQKRKQKNNISFILPFKSFVNFYYLKENRYELGEDTVYDLKKDYIIGFNFIDTMCYHSFVKVLKKGKEMTVNQKKKEEYINSVKEDIKDTKKEAESNFRKYEVIIEDVLQASHK